MKKSAKGSPKLFHTPSPKSKQIGGTAYGTGYKNPTATSREIMGVKPYKKASLSKPPRSLA
jgi:hypothetical protein